MISQRSLEVLRAIVNDYIETSQPVGSKSLVERHGFSVSSATIRNEMAILEDEQLIVAPHTSSGRIPTDKGYRMFVDRLGEVKPLSIAERTAIENFMQGSSDLDEILGKTVRVLSQLTNQVAMVQYPSLEHGNVKNIQLVHIDAHQVIILLVTDISRVQQHMAILSEPVTVEQVEELRGRLNSLAGKSLSSVASALNEIRTDLQAKDLVLFTAVEAALLDLVDANRQDKIILAGTANLAKTEDLRGNISPLLEAIEEQVVLLKLIQELQAEQHGVALRIGSENPLDQFASSSIVVGSYEKQGAEVAKVGVLGPTRMNYSNNIAAVRAVARYLTQTLGGI